MTTERIIPIADIIIDRDNRQRKEITIASIQDLADSISQVGLINPIVVRDGNVLVAGERRLTAAKFLEWETIRVTDLSSLDQATAMQIELEENLKRLDLTWQDRVAAIAAYHNQRVEADSTWTQSDTARTLSMSPAEVSRHLAVHQAVLDGDDLVLKAERFSIATNIIARAQERARDSKKETINAVFASQSAAGKAASTSPGNTEQAADSTAAASAPDILATDPTADSKQLRAPILNVDFHEWVRAYTGPKFNFIHCDFPYGIGADKHDQGAAKIFGGYADSPDVYWPLLARFLENQEQFIADSAHLMFWFSMDFYHETKIALESHGWRVNKMPLIWMKSDNTGVLPDPARGPRYIYETALLASRGDRKVVQSVSNAFAHPGGGKKVHMSEKPLAMLKHFFRMFVDRNTVMLDPTAGSANAVRAAFDMGAHDVLGLEREVDFYDRAVDAWHERDQLGLDLDL